MLFDQATPAQLQTARLLMGTAMAGFVAAGLLRGRGRALRLAIAGLYIAAVLAFIVYAAL
jgi:hypothetical protein|nr:hypothetical protein [uncultured Rhodopila sp.]